MGNPQFKAWFQCIAGCTGTFPLDQIIYRCPTCGELLEVQHDLDALRARTPEKWKKLFSERLRHPKGAFASGVWSKHEWVCPEIDTDQIVSLGEGRSPLVEPKRLSQKLGGHLAFKLCGNSHTGSFKDLGMTVLVSVVNQMINQGQTIKAVACASTGDTSAAVSAYCSAAGIASVVLLPRNKISTAQLIQPVANGALTLSLDTDFDGCMTLIQELTASGEIYLANSMNSLRVEGQKTVAIELAEQLDWQLPDWIIVPGGNLGNISAIGKALLEMYSVGLIDRLPRLVCAQAEKANPLYESYQRGFANLEPQTARTTLASAIQIGHPVSFRKAVSVLQRLDGVVEQATEDELANAAALADQNGLFACPQTGVAFGVFLKLLDNRQIRPTERTVIVSTAHGLKFTSFKSGYHENRLAGVQAKYANPPREIAANIDSVREVLSGI